MNEPIQIVITLDPATNRVNVAGPVTDKVLCYGMLGMAHDAIKDFNPAAQPKIIPIHGSLNGGPQ